MHFETKSIILHIYTVKFVKKSNENFENEKKKSTY